MTTAPKYDPNKGANLAAEYGWGLAVMKSDPDLWKIFQNAVATGQSADGFRAAVQGTKWYKTHSDAWRQATMQRLEDPATYKEQVSQFEASITQKASELGIPLHGTQIAAFAQQSMLNGWTLDQLHEHMGAMVNEAMLTKGIGGSLETSRENLANWAADNGQEVSNPTMAKWISQIASGTGSEQGFKSLITKQAQAAHPNWANELNQGMSLRDIANPYINSMANLLEMDPHAVQVTNPLIKQALTNTDDKGNVSAMSLNQFEQSVRKDPRWQYTDNARNTIGQVADSLAKSWGIGQ